ncbi:MAG: hypothetical protein IPM70_16930 [Proteobacteria bacterium]|jgi:hypothetical protein|nr:hypothetical protein [Pseudomonadota bacterium]MBK7116852.1 hypothetical protein [Pseudomonadota bacterium]MBK9253440.1 hypothetical protein [Pseudomonadota bacterium]MCC6630708.1 hypothetical protein [Gammaproteobacteria bacterium]
MTNTKFSRAALSLLGAAALIGAATVSQAHHSFAAQYDSNKPTSLEGVVTKVEWTNPHVYIYIDVTDAKTQKVSNWGFEMGPPHMLMRTGWKRNSLKIGEEVSVDGWLARDGSNTANARRVTRKANGEVMGAASSNSQTLAGNAGTQAQ